MTNNVVRISSASDIPGMLRQMADEVESRDDKPESLTIVMGGELYCFGPVHNDQAAVRCLWDLELGKTVLLGSAGLL